MKTQNNNQTNTDSQETLEVVFNTDFYSLAQSLLASTQLNMNVGYTHEIMVNMMVGSHMVRTPKECRPSASAEGVLHAIPDDAVTDPKLLKDLVFGEGGQVLVQSQQGIHEFDLTEHKNDCLGKLLLPFNIYSEKVGNGYQIEVLLDGKENSGNNRVTAFYSDLHEGEVPESLFHSFMYLLALEPEQWKVSIMVLLYQLGYELQGKQKLDSHGCMTLAAELFNHHMEKNNQVS